MSKTVHPLSDLLDRILLDSLCEHLFYTGPEDAHLTCYGIRQWRYALEYLNKKGWVESVYSGFEESLWRLTPKGLAATGRSLI